MTSPPAARSTAPPPRPASGLALLDDLPDPTPDPDGFELELVPPPARRPVVLGMLELFTVVGLIGAAGALQVVSNDTLTLLALLIVGVVWATFSLRAWTFVPRTEDLHAQLHRRARGRLVRLDERPHLPAEAPAAIVAEAAEDPRWQLPGWMSTGQGVLVSLGLVGTFLGLTIGLYQSAGALGSGDEKAISDGMGHLLDGAKLAFVKSLAGVFCGMVWSLRYRRIEVAHESWFEEQRAWLSARYPLVTELELAVRLDDRRRDDHRALTEALGRWATRGDERATALLEAVDQATTGASRERGAQLDKVTTGVDQLSELRELIDSLSKTLPENIGDQTAGFLRPSLHQMAAALAELSSAGGQAIGTTLHDSMGAEMTGLRQSLGEMSRLFEGLGPRVEQQVQQGAATAASALSEAGRQTSQDLRAAASELTGGVGELQAMAEAIRAALGETHQVAGALRGAGEEVATGLRGVAEPLSVLPIAFESARSAIFAAQDGLTRANVASTAQTDRLTHLTQVTERATELQRDLSGNTEQLAAEVDRVRAACMATVEALKASSAGQQTAGAEAAQQLVRTVTAFQASLEQTQRAVSEASQSTFEGAQVVTLQAAKQVADALAGGAVTFEQSLGRLASFSEEIERSLTGAQKVVAAIDGHAQQLQAGVALVSRPLGDIAAALGQVAPEVRDATAAVKAERETLGTLGRELAGQASTLRASSDSLAERIIEYKGLQQTLSKEWAIHITGIDQLLERIQKSWVLAVQAGDTGLQQNALKIATYAKKVQDSLTITDDVRNLTETLQTLADVLEEQHLQQKARL